MRRLIKRHKVAPLRFQTALRLRLLLVLAGPVHLRVAQCPDATTDAQIRMRATLGRDDAHRKHENVGTHWHGFDAGAAATRTARADSTLCLGQARRGKEGARRPHQGCIEMLMHVGLWVFRCPDRFSRLGVSAKCTSVLLARMYRLHIDHPTACRLTDAQVYFTISVLTLQGALSREECRTVRHHAKQLVLPRGTRCASRPPFRCSRAVDVPAKQRIRAKAYLSLTQSIPGPPNPAETAETAQLAQTAPLTREDSIAGRDTEPTRTAPLADAHQMQ